MCVSFLKCLCFRGLNDIGQATSKWFKSAAFRKRGNEEMYKWFRLEMFRKGVLNENERYKMWNN